VAAHPTSGWAAVGIVLAYLAGQGALVGLIIWYGIHVGSDKHERALRKWARRHRGLARELESLDDALRQIWSDEVTAGRQRADQDALRLISDQIPLVEFHVTARRVEETCTELRFADGTTLILWSSQPDCERSLRHLPPHAAIQYIATGADAIVLGTDTTSIRIPGELLELAG
jgi:hypothetical protein